MSEVFNNTYFGGDDDLWLNGNLVDNDWRLARRDLRGLRWTAEATPSGVQIGPWILDASLN